MTQLTANEQWALPRRERGSPSRESPPTRMDEQFTRLRERRSAAAAH
jgi:hypothetical protein